MTLDVKGPLKSGNTAQGGRSHTKEKEKKEKKNVNEICYTTSR